MGHPDFRVRGKIFVTLAWPDASWGMVKLTPEQQRMFVRGGAAAFVPVADGWGRRGSTNVRLALARPAAVRGALVAAWLNTAPASFGRRTRVAAPAVPRGGPAAAPRASARPRYQASRHPPPFALIQFCCTRKSLPPRFMLAVAPLAVG
jgi:hypothetical protein